MIQFEGDQHYLYRMLRSTKNRFGSTSEMGIYEMRQDGLRQVSNPSELLIAEEHDGLSGVAITSAIEGVRPFLVETQALVSTAAYGTPQRSATGFDQRRLNMLLAVLEKRVGFKPDAERCVSEYCRRFAGDGYGHGSECNSCRTLQQCRHADRARMVYVRRSRPQWRGASGGTTGAADCRSSEKLGFQHIIVPAYNMKNIDTKKYKIELHPVRKVEGALRTLFG